MKIVVLDGYTLNPGDLSWKRLEDHGDLTVYDRTPPELVYERSANADIVFTNKTPLNGEVIHRLDKLRFIGVLATGYNVIDVAAAKGKGIIVSNVPGYGTSSVAQFTFALLLELCHRVQKHSDTVVGGRWSASPDFSYWDSPLIELAGKTIGIIGFGDIGSKVGDLATAFGMNIIATGRKQTGQEHRQNFKWADIDTLLSESDVVSLHCPLFPETQGLFNAQRLKKMKPSAFLINTSRGPLIVEKDLADALNNEIIAGAALDVLSVEPPSINNPLLKTKNCIITPHIAWATKEARQKLMGVAVNNLSEFIKGRPVNIVNA
ncbi:D-2-hydroxyacid dehydrogenase [Daejeonella sp.]|uniref:D-2-hydroxyacid dehydrogenase n=1 Tax=Daejeonella sp. TaxID=2805397 RepID=UPI0030BABDE6